MDQVVSYTYIHVLDKRGREAPGPGVCLVGEGETANYDVCDNIKKKNFVATGLFFFSFYVREVFARAKNARFGFHKTPLAFPFLFCLGDGVSGGNLFCHAYLRIAIVILKMAVALGGQGCSIREYPTLPPEYYPWSWSLKPWSIGNGDEFDAE
jgi:hypothetical protein